MSHTPGPWEIRPTPESSHQSYKVRADGNTVARVDVQKTVEVELDNARLIAAAPDLLAALEMLLPNLDKNLMVCHWARNAIKKARGE